MYCNLRVAHNGEDKEMDVVADGAHTVTVGRTTGTPNTAAGMAVSLQRAIVRDPNPNGKWKGAILSTDGASLLIDTADGRTFIATIREVS